MLHKVGSQVFPGKLAALQHICCSREIACERPDMAFLKRSGNRCCIVGISIEALGQFQFVLDTIETAGKCGREDEIEVGIAARSALLDADGPACKLGTP